MQAFYIKYYYGVWDRLVLLKLPFQKRKLSEIQQINNSDVTCMTCSGVFEISFVSALMNRVH